MKHFIPAFSVKWAFVVFLLVVLSKSFANGQAVSAEDTGEREIFMWVGAQKLQKQQPATLENMLLFARRFDIIPYSSGMHDPDKLERFLGLCRRLDIDKTWIETGPGEGVSVREFVKDSAARRPTLERFRKLARVYQAHYPDFARITLFDEAPLGAFKKQVAGSENDYTSRVQNFMEYGPQAFSYIREAIQQEMPKAEVGIFMHHPHNASFSMSGSHSLIGRFVEECVRQQEKPDFIFSDVYRGYFTRGYGMERTNAYVKDVARYTKGVADEHRIKAYQLGQMHTIKLGYTPSRMEIDQNVEAMLQGGLDGMGWYWPNYASTNYTRTSGKGIGRPLNYQISHDPFVPNAWGKTGPAGSVYATSKDRFVYAYLRMAEETRPVHSTTHFDLWIDGHDFDHTEHSLYLKTTGENGGNWELIGHFNPQHDKQAYEEGARQEYIYSYNDQWHALAFHGLSRQRYLLKNEAGFQARVKITTRSESDTSRLSAVYLMPYRPTRNYLTERRINDFVRNQPRWVKTNSLASSVWPASKELYPGDSCIVKVE